MSKPLTEEQAEILQFAKSGHNLLITGQAGAGKSTVVNSIRQDCKQRGLNVAIVCSSGIACKVYENGVASTVHSFYGLGAADMPSKQLIHRAVGDRRLCEKLRTVDVLIWDEASMSSARMMELVNALHHHLTCEEPGLERLPFAGKQVIIVGEFLQLRPVPNPFDSGDFMFKSIVFQHAIAHRFELTKVLRQSDGDKIFAAALKDLRYGKCSQETADCMEQLSRELEPGLAENATHIFFKRNGALLFNRSALNVLGGEMFKFNATFEGNGAKVKWPGEKVLFLKKNCKVMLIWNKSEILKNGSMGIFKGVKDDDTLQVQFEDVGTVSIRRETWIQRNRLGERIGSVIQFPIVLAYAVTCHKSQGLELPAVVLHSSKEFVPGLIYVAVSRVRSADTLQVTGFNTHQVLPADPEVIQQCGHATGVNDPSLHCCRRKAADDDVFFEVKDKFQLLESDETEDCIYQFPIEMSDGMVYAYFEREDSDDDVALTVAQLYEKMERHESELSRPPPEGLDTSAILSKFRVDSPCNDFSRSVNEAVGKLLGTDHSDNVKAFVNIMWFHSFVALEQHIIDSPEQIDVTVSRGDFTKAIAKLHGLLRSEEFTHYVVCLFNVSSCTSAQRSIGVQLAKAVYFSFLEHLQSVTVKDLQQEAVVLNVEEMSAAGRGKVRHVGGWAVRKVLEQSRRYVRTNIHSENAITMRTVQTHHEICEMIEESLVGSLAVLEQASLHKDTLQVTEARQFRERGLIHIEDGVYHFFMALESARVQLLNNALMCKEKANMAEVAYQRLLNNEDLKLKWRECFSREDLENKEVISMFLFYIFFRELQNKMLSSGSTLYSNKHVVYG